MLVDAQPWSELPLTSGELFVYRVKEADLDRIREKGWQVRQVPETRLYRLERTEP
jgi:hypothetical protein